MKQQCIAGHTERRKYLSIQILTMATLTERRLPRLLMTLLTVAVMLRPSSGLQCYTCNSHFDAQCGDPFISEAGGVRRGER